MSRRGGSTLEYECPQQSLLIITSGLETNKIETRSYLLRLRGARCKAAATRA